MEHEKKKLTLHALCDEYKCETSCNQQQEMMNSERVLCQGTTINETAAVQIIIRWEILHMLGFRADVRQNTNNKCDARTEPYNTYNHNQIDNDR